MNCSKCLHAINTTGMPKTKAFNFARSFLRARVGAVEHTSLP